MATRKHSFVVGEYYHIYNRGVDKRDIFIDLFDLKRFLQCLEDFNTLLPVGSIYELSFQKPKLSSPATKSEKLISIIAYCVNPNHFHLILTPLVENGVEKFMQRIGGYTRYFNERHKRNGVLFQGKFKSKLISDNTYLLHLSTYVNMNNRNSNGIPIYELSKSSLEEYISDKKGICSTALILKQFKNKNVYKRFAFDSWQDSQNIKEELEN
ncbi:MAG: transposase [archaeon]